MASTSGLETRRNQTASCKHKKRGNYFRSRSEKVQNLSNNSNSNSISNSNSNSNSNLSKNGASRSETSRTNIKTWRLRNFRFERKTYQITQIQSQFQIQIQTYQKTYQKTVRLESSKTYQLNCKFQVARIKNVAITSGLEARHAEKPKNKGKNALKWVP